MTSDIDRARRLRRREVRRAIRRAWADQLTFHFEVSWPSGLLGALIGVLLILTPPLFFWVSARLWKCFQWLKPGTGPRSAA